jgi:glyoxylase-like metal-dependent hydrolase (beta-lactamase superfamily II)
MNSPQAGKTVSVSDSVTRILAPNPSVFTGPGTNTFVIARGKNIAVLDPGPDDGAHIDAIIDAARALGGNITDILCTHTHEDHSPGATPLAARTGARLIGTLAPDDGYNDTRFRPDHIPVDGEQLAVGGVTLRAIATPGHVSNHQCFLLEEEGLLFTGDHIMQGSTVVIVPPEGSMRDYLDSLGRLQTLPLQAIAPGHGERLDDPVHVLAATTRHRLAREAKTLRALRDLRHAGLDELLPRVYDDVPAFMHAIARLSLHAHLIKLVEDGVIAEEAAGRWQA